MWYLNYLLFAATEPESKGEYVCETCNILLEAATAEDTYQAAELWGKEYESENLRFIGVEELNYIQEDQPGHGDEIAGSFFDEQDIWSRISKFVPPKNKLNAIRIEGSNANKPIGELIDDQMEKRLKRVFKSK